MVKRRRFNPQDDWNRLLRTKEVLVHKPLTRQELAVASKPILRWMIGTAVVTLLLVAFLTVRKLQDSPRSIVAIEAMLSNAYSEKRERALRIATRDGWDRQVGCSSLLRALADSSQRVRSAAIPTLVGALSSKHCTGQLLMVLDSTKSGEARRVLLQIVSALDSGMLQVAHRSLLRALGSDYESDGAAAAAIATSGIHDSASLSALRAAFWRGRGVARGEALSALLKLEPHCRNFTFIEEVLRDDDPMMRQIAVESIEPLLVDRSLHCAGIPQALHAAAADTAKGVRAVALRMLSQITY